MNRELIRYKIKFWEAEYDRMLPIHTKATFGIYKGTATEFDKQAGRGAWKRMKKCAEEINKLEKELQKTK